jgi:hypothetical protein
MSRPRVYYKIPFDSFDGIPEIGATIHFKEKTSEGPIGYVAYIITKIHPRLKQVTARKQK